jgi:hypothetical protein
MGKRLFKIFQMLLIYTNTEYHPLLIVTYGAMEKANVSGSARLAGWWIILHAAGRHDYQISW